MVRPGKSVIKFFSRAAVRVVRVGEKRAACEKATMSASLRVPMTALAAFAGGLSGTCQRPVLGHLLPLRTSLLLCLISKSCLVNVAVQPASQSLDRDRRLVLVSLVGIYPFTFTPKLEVI